VIRSAFILGLLLATSCATAPPAPDKDGLVTGKGMVKSYRIADPGGEGNVPLAYWLDLSGWEHGPLYVHVGEVDVGRDRYVSRAAIINRLPPAKTAFDPRFDRYLIRGTKLRFRGKLMDGHVDTAVPGGSVQIVYDAKRVSTLAAMKVGELVTFEGVIHPRTPWMKKFIREKYRQDWHLIVTLPGGELIEITDRALMEHRDFRVCVGLMRNTRAVRVRVVGRVHGAAGFRVTDDLVKKYAGTPRAIRGALVVVAEELAILSSAPADKILP
jgi:hypothetical protein